MDKQRLKNAEDDKRSDQIPFTDTSMSIEVDAFKLYTLELYYLVREEIKAACYHTSMPDITRDNEHRYFKVKDDLLHDKIFEVSVRLSDNYVQCNCKFFFQRGYLCKHAFAALHQCGVKQIPREFVKPRWTKNALKRHSFLGSSQVDALFEKRDKKKLKRTRAWFEFHNCMNHAEEDEEKLDSVITGLQTIASSITKDSDNNMDQGNAERVDKFIGPIPDTEISVQIPHVSRNKGSGSRIKSSREIAIEAGKRRTCSRCKLAAGHNARSCPLNKECT
ncbi:protein FAR1-RELATED SEQUENCE 6-like [Apium graveolens]|uniref:protein FAR1-RELATED SEQUENCE 6-like n=1 Tax=Apium graveolens TaxID=4045 RepID=UPI003D7A6C80